MVVIFNFRLCQGCTATGTPVDRFFTPDHTAALEKAPQLPSNGRFVGIRHGQVGVVPFTQYPKAFEFLALNVNEPFRISPAMPPDFHLGQSRFPRSQLAINLVFDGQTVAVPTGHIDRVETAHLTAFHNHIFKNLVKGRTQVNIPVCIGRTIMEDI